MPEPACPYCGERQGYDDARPSKPYVVSCNMGLGRVEKHTQWNTHCRACEQRIIWGFTFGNGTLAQMNRPAVYHWSKP